MKNQVATIEQSKRLIELGVPAEKASMVYVNNANIPSFKAELISAGIDLEELNNDGHEYAPAFTVADLLGVMPPDIPAVVGQNHDYALTLSNNFCWSLRYENSHTHQCIGEQLEFDLVDLICNRIEWILSNRYELNL